MGQADTDAMLEAEHRWAEEHHLPWPPVGGCGTTTKRREQEAHQRALTLEHELIEANAEMARHHRDFERIQQILDRFDNSGDPDAIKGVRALVAIRNIVG